MPPGARIGAVPGAFALPPEPPSVVGDLTGQVVERLCVEVCELAVGVIARLRELDADLPASADHHHSEPYGLLRHSLEVALKMLEEFEKTVVAEARARPQPRHFDAPAGFSTTAIPLLPPGLGHDLGKLF